MMPVRAAPRAVQGETVTEIQRSVLNVGGNSKQIAIPAHYDGFAHLLLDIDPIGQPDVLCDARELQTRAGNAFDAIYCSHNLEHYFWHDVQRVLRGFWHVLKPGGMAEIRVPDLISVMDRVVNHGVGLNDTLYNSSAGPIAPLDVLYGWRQQIEQSGVDFYAHKTGFSQDSLRSVVRDAGFTSVFDVKTSAGFEAHVLAFKGRPDDYFVQRLKLPLQS